MSVPYAIKGGGFHFRQWNDPARKKSVPIEDSSSISIEPEPTTPECSHCHSQNLRPAGWFTSKLWEELHEDVQCRDCKKYSRLPVGVVLPKKSPRAIDTESVVLANDTRPACPRCNESRVQRRDKLPSGKRRYFCTNCKSRFIAEDSAEFIDHRKVQHWDEIDPREEAAFLFRYAVRHGNVANVREDIGVSDHEKNDLEFLVADGVLPRAEVDDAIWFRAQVLEVFDELVHARAQRIRARELAVLADAGMLASTLVEPMARFRDDMLQPFDNLIDVEAACIAVPEPEKVCEPASAFPGSQCAKAGEKIRRLQTQEGEAEGSASPVFVAKER